MLVLALLLAWLPGQSAAPAADLNALFNQGVEWRPWFDDIRTQQNTWRQVASQVSPPNVLVDRLKAAGANLKLLVVAEANCSDSMQSVPHIAALADRAGVPLRIVGKDAAAAAIERHRTPDGRTATPTVILLRDGKDAGAWVERPEALQTWFIANAGLSRAERLERKTAWYQWDRGGATLAEIVALAERR